MTQEEREKFAEHLTMVGERYAEAIDRAMTLTSLELVNEPPEVLQSSQITSLLMIAARRTARAKMPDMALFAILKEALSAAKTEVEG
jgi:hypothetical protein